MRIVISLAENEGETSKVALQFGRASYLGVKADKTPARIIVNPGQSKQSGAGVAAAQAVVEPPLQGEVLLTGSVGPKAWQALKAGQLKIYQLTAAEKTLAEAVAAFEAGKLVQLTVSKKTGLANKAGF